MSRGGVGERRRYGRAGAAGPQDLAGAGVQAGRDEDGVAGRTRWLAPDKT